MPTLKRMPPPPPIAVNDPIFNRWLHDISAFIGSNGIDTSQIPGWDTLVADVAMNTDNIAANTDDIATNTANIATNRAGITSNTNNIATNTSDIAANTSAISTHTGQISALAVRSQVLNGTTAPAAGLGANGDWYADTSAKHISVKVAGAWVQIV
jgi:methyl-accepting chemotaxis protein